MALASNALTSVASLKRYMRNQIQETDFFRVYHDGSGGESSATIKVTSTAVVLTDTVTGTSTLTFAANSTNTAMVAAINAVAGYVATLEGDGSLTSSDMREEPTAINIFTSAREAYLRGFDSLMLEDAINAASDEIERHTGRTFAETTHRHALNGSGGEDLCLPQWPVSGVTYVTIGREEALTVKYTDNTQMLAMVEVTSTALKLTVNNGAATSIDWATYATVTAVLDQINAQSNWSASLGNGNAGSWPSAELLIMPPQNALSRTVSVNAPADADVEYQLHDESGILKRIDDLGFHDQGLVHSYGFPRLFNKWPDGRFNIVVKYTAGYSATPDDVVDICNMLASTMIREGFRDQALSAESAGGASYSASGEGVLTDAIRRRLAKHKNPHRPEYALV